MKRKKHRKKKKKLKNTKNTKKIQNSYKLYQNGYKMILWKQFTEIKRNSLNTYISQNPNSIKEKKIEKRKKIHR